MAKSPGGVEIIRTTTSHIDEMTSPARISGKIIIKDFSSALCMNFKDQ